MTAGGSGGDGRGAQSGRTTSMGRRALGSPPVLAVGSGVVERAGAMGGVDRFDEFDIR